MSNLCLSYDYFQDNYKFKVIDSINEWKEKRLSEKKEREKN